MLKRLLLTIIIVIITITTIKFQIDLVTRKQNSVGTNIIGCDYYFIEAERLK